MFGCLACMCLVALLFVVCLLFNSNRNSNRNSNSNSNSNRHTQKDTHRQPHTDCMTLGYDTTS